MTITWAVRFPGLDLPQMGRLWNVPEVEVCQQPEECWLRGPKLDERVQEILRGFLSGQRFQVLADGQIRSPRNRVPKGYLPEGPWQPLREWMTLSLPPSVWPGKVDEKVPMQLVRDTFLQVPRMLTTGIAAWLRFGGDSPQVRLNPFRFAMTPRGEVIVLGQPLPSIAGRPFVVTGQIAVPAGWTWAPGVESAVLEKLFDLEPGDLAVLQPDGTWYAVRRDSFVRATRQAIRASAESIRS